MLYANLKVQEGVVQIVIKHAVLWPIQTSLEHLFERIARPFRALIVPWVIQKQGPGTKPVRGGGGRVSPLLSVTNKAPLIRPRKVQ